MSKGNKKQMINQKMIPGFSMSGVAELCPDLNSPELHAATKQTIESICDSFKIALSNFLEHKSSTPKRLCLRFLLADCDQEIKRSEKGSKREVLLLAIRLLIEAEWGGQIQIPGITAIKQILLQEECEVSLGMSTSTPNKMPLHWSKSMKEYSSCHISKPFISKMPFNTPNISCRLFHLFSVCKSRAKIILEDNQERISRIQYTHLRLF